MPVTFSSDSDCVTVTTAGRVTGVSPGRAVITARTADGRHTATCYIEVSENMLVHSGDYTVDRDTETVLVPYGTTAEALLPAFRQPQGIIGGICVVVVATVLPYIFYTKGLEGVESGRASIITNIEPVVETLVGITVFHEALTVWTVLGVGCVIGCVALLAREGRYEREAAAE